MWCTKIETIFSLNYIQRITTGKTILVLGYHFVKTTITCGGCYCRDDSRGLGKASTDESHRGVCHDRPVSIVILQVKQTETVSGTRKVFTRYADKRRP